MLARLARWSFRRRKVMVFAIWLPLLIGLIAVSGAVGTNFSTSFDLPESESKEVIDVLEAVGSDEDAGDIAQIVFTAEQGTDDPAVVAAMTQLFERVEQLEGVKITSPYSPEGAQFNSVTAPISFAQIAYTMRDQAEWIALADEIQALADDIQVPGLTIEYGGQLFAVFEFPESELLGILAAIIILLVAFGSVLAMGLPIGTALFGLGVGIGIVGLGSNVVSMPEFSSQMTAMIGLGVGIDYALFIVTRYRENLRDGMEPEEATVEAADTAGRAVVFAGITVMISLLGLFVIGIEFVRGLAIAGATGVLMMMFAAITLLPALLGFVQRRIDVTTRAAAISVVLFVGLMLLGIFTGLELGLAALVAVGLSVVLMLASFVGPGKALRTPLPHRHEKPLEEQFWYRWSRSIQRRPWPYFAGGALVLIVLALPLLSIRMGFGDTGNLPEEQTARRAYDLLGTGFGEGSSGPLVLVSTDPAATAETVQSVDAVLAAEPGLAFASPGTQIAEGTWIWQAYPVSSPQDVETTELVERLRGESLPSTGLDVNVGGFTAGSIDFSAYLGKRLPILIGAVLVLSFLLLMAVFRSLLVPLKAVIMNLLSVGAAYGVIVAIFQWGWAKDLFGIGKEGPVEAWAPMMLFAIVFGLSMDYEVFLLSRMKEQFDRTGDNGLAVADGLAATARVITAAALIMVCVFGAFVLGNDRQLKLFGLGMAVAVFVDATIVRMILVPATMELLGNKNWWIPKWIDRILPKIHVEGHAHQHEGAETADGDRQPELV
ncbi:MAG: MMPL family transporter [Actinobacteria bacterium]|nr:MMPL family transporter [Actinomycetota bacterium]